MPKIAITGANGFIGHYLCQYFVDQGWEVLALCHRYPSDRIRQVNYQRYSLEKPLREDWFEGCDMVVHAAYARYSVRQRNAAEINLMGTAAIIDECRRHQVRKLVFLSSFSAHPLAKSAYGKSKFEVETLFDRNRDCIFRLGLVVGRGGLAFALINFIRKWPIVPLIGGGGQPVQTLAVSDVANLILRCYASDISGRYSVANLPGETLGAFCRNVARLSFMKRVFVPVPYWIAYLVIWTMERFGVGGIRIENLSGLRRLRVVDTRFDLDRLRFSVSSSDQAVWSVLESLRGD